MENIGLCVNVSDIANRNSYQMKKYRNMKLKKEYQNLVFEIDYPFDFTVKVEIPKASTVADVLTPIADKYAEVYSKPLKPNSCWHSIDDLCFTDIVINEEGLSEFLVDS